jgi:gamma-glutamyltranspeptidase / glutathione hydrolase
MNPSRTGTTLGPAQWSDQERQRYLDLESRFGQGSVGAVSSKGMVAGTSGPVAVHAGLGALEHGGTAADAALTTALTQIAGFAGATVSYAGVLTAVYYDAASGGVHTLNAAYNSVRDEKDALSIPAMGEHSGRTALVPGFMAGVQALHDRFGRLPFATLFDPAIWVAEHGIPVSPVLGAWLSAHARFVTRLPESKRIFMKENGELHAAGDLLRQPELAATLERVASQGAAYMYEGEWARHLIDAVQRDGGKMTLDDLAMYRPMWTEPLESSHRDYTIVSLGSPNRGGLQTLASLKMAEVADLPTYGHYTTSPEGLYSLIQISRIQGMLATAPAALLEGTFPGVDLSSGSRLSRDTAERLWAHVRKRMTLPVQQPSRSEHSAGVLAVDERGNVACVLHSFNGALWGSTGIFVDGISIPDSACFQQRLIAEVGPGARLPDPSNPLIVLEGGRPVLASTTIGAALHQATVQNVVNVLDFAMDPQTSVDQPNSRGPFYGISMTGQPAPEWEKEAIGVGDFSDLVLDGVRARGQAIKIVGQQDQVGYWAGIRIDPRAHTLSGAINSKLNGLVEGY